MNDEILQQTPKKSLKWEQKGITAFLLGDEWGRDGEGGRGKIWKNSLKKKQTQKDMSIKKKKTKKLRKKKKIDTRQSVWNKRNETISTYDENMTRFMMCARGVLYYIL